MKKHYYSGYKHFLEEIKKHITNEKERLFKKIFEDHPFEFILNGDIEDN